MKEKEWMRQEFYKVYEHKRTKQAELYLMDLLEEFKRAHEEFDEPMPERYRVTIHVAEVIKDDELYEFIPEITKTIIPPDDIEDDCLPDLDDHRDDIILD